MKKAYFQYYETFENVIEKIKDLEEREHFRKIIIRYGLYNEEPSGLTELEDVAWAICKDLIDQQRHRRETNSANATKKKKDPEPKPKVEKKSAFVKPTLEQITAFCKEKGYRINIQKFYSHYESNGWKVGKNAMKSWQAAVAKWYADDKGAGTIWQNGDSETDKYEDLF